MDALTHRWTVRVRADGPDDATALARRHAIRLGAAAGFDDAAPLPSAIEALLGALGADVLATFAATARRARVPIDALEAVVWCSLENPLVHLGVIGETGSPRVSTIVATVYVASEAPLEVLTDLWSEARTRSPLYATLERSAHVDIRLCVTV